MTMQKGDIVLLDGGLGQELYRRYGQPATPIWSAQVQLQAPHIVEAVHLDFIRAGARVITLNTYTVTPPRLARVGKADSFDKLQASAIAAAQSARDKSGQDVAIAGCLSPLVASYRPDLAPDHDTSLALYQRIVAAQSDHVDLFLCETLASVAEARAATTAASESGKPVWTAFTVDDTAGTKLRSGESVLAGARAALDAGAEAVLINCARPEAVSEAIETLATTAKTFGGFANGFAAVDALLPGGTVDVLEARSDLDPIAYAVHAMQWVTAGARIVGGCCEVGPAHIAELSHRLVTEGYKPVARLDA